MINDPDFQEYLRQQAELQHRLDRARGIRTQSENPTPPRKPRSAVAAGHRRKNKIARASRRNNR